MPRSPSSAPSVVGNLKNTTLLEQRRQELVRCATEVFVERRFDKASVNEIAERCGWAIGSLYRYVSSKEDILVLVCDEIFRNLSIDELRSASGDDPVAGLRTVLGGYCDNVDKNRAQVLLMYREYTQLPPEAQEHFKRRESEIYEALAAIVTEGVERGIFTCEDPHLFAVDCVMRVHALALKRWALRRTSYKKTKELLLQWSLRSLGVHDAAPR
jgi:TetR/AcrR family transcriptional regulator, cholesterol catabolism regulator